MVTTVVTIKFFVVIYGFRVSNNPALHANQWPLPRTEDVFLSLAGGKQGKQSSHTNLNIISAC